MKIKSLYPVIVVDNMENAVKFYTEVLGFSVKHQATRKDNGKVVVIANEQGLQIELMDKFNGGPVEVPHGLYGFRMNIDNAEEALKELDEKGVKVITSLDTGLGKNIILRDADNVGITLMEHIKKEQ